VVCFFYVLAIARVIPADRQSRVGQATALPRERIVYTTLRPANWHLFLLEAGSPPKQITDDPALDHGATFSPDGKWVVFTSGRGGLNDEAPISDGDGPPPLGEICVAPVDGKSEPIRLTHNKWSDGLSCWGEQRRAVFFAESSAPKE
jgi:Tol biopolymer transport system component